MESLGNKILELRKNNRFSQDELAERIGVTRQAISKWERGDGLPDLYNIKSLANVFGVSVDELLDNKNDIKECEQPDNKLALILLGIPNFIYGVGLIGAFLFSLATSVMMISELFTPYGMDLSINTHVIFFPLGLLICFLLLNLFLNLYTGKKSNTTKNLTLGLYGLLILAYLSLLLSGEITGFSFIFLYIIGLLILITGLAGTLLFDTTFKKEISNKLNKFANTTSKILKWYILTIILIIPISIAKESLLVKDFRYINSVEIRNNEIDDETYMFLDLNETSQSGSYQLLTNLKFNLADENISQPYLKIYINNVLVSEGEFIGIDSFDFDYHYYIDLENVAIDFIPVLNSGVIVLVEISYLDGDNQLIELDQYINGDYSLEYRTRSVWIWNYKEMT